MDPINNVQTEQQAMLISLLYEEQKLGLVEDKTEEIQVQLVLQIEILHLCVEQLLKHMQMERRVMEQTPSVHQVLLHLVHQPFLLREQQKPGPVRVQMDEQRFLVVQVKILHELQVLYVQHHQIIRTITKRGLIKHFQRQHSVVLVMDHQFHQIIRVDK
jgi:hypothetical protein